MQCRNSFTGTLLLRNPTLAVSMESKMSAFMASKLSKVCLQKYEQWTGVIFSDLKKKFDFVFGCGIVT
jgi:hypothetical protein